MVLPALDKSVERYPRTLNLMLNPAERTGELYRILRALPDNAFGIVPSTPISPLSTTRSDHLFFFEISCR